MQKFNAKLLVITLILFVILNPFEAFSQHENHQQVDSAATKAVAAQHDSHAEEKKEFNAVEMIMEHISDANEWHVATINNEHYSIPLPVIVWDGSLKAFMSSAAAHGHEHDGYTLHEGKLVSTAGLEKAGLVDLFTGLEGKYVDLSITKNVAGILISCLLLFFVFRAVSKGYKNGVPTGIAGFLEPVILFIRDEVAIPNIGYKDAARFLPLLLTIFFFIWFNNLLGLVPLFPGGANVTGNIAVTLVLALVTMVVVNVNGKGTYWKHIFKPDVPVLMYVIMIPVEVIGIFTKPFALMMRLFANITAGHIMILSLISLIFIFQNALVGIASVPLALFISILELLVAALQAYIFTVLTALFIGMAVQEHH